MGQSKGANDLVLQEEKKTQWNKQKQKQTKNNF